MSKLIRLNSVSSKVELDSLLNDIFTNEIVVFEDVQGSKILVNWTGENFIIKPRNLGSEPISLIDLATQNYYNHAISFLDSLDNRIKSLLNKGWWFVFEYFPDSNPGNIEYNRIPKNNLVLSSICKGNKYTYNIDEIDEYSRLLNVDMTPIIFKGQLNEKVIEAIKYFLNTSENDLEYVFGEKSFAFFFYKLLSPVTSHSFLMEDGDFQKNLEKLIIRIENKEASFELLNPLYKRISDDNSTSFQDIYSLIIVNFLNFCQSVDFKEIKLKGNRREDVYIYLICKLFNLYLSEVYDDILAFDIVIPEFFDKDKFRINKELITNKLTKEYIDGDKKIEYLYKVILGSFNKKKKRLIGVFTEKTLEIFNTYIDKINANIDIYLNKKSETELMNKGLVDFGAFLDIDYDHDGDNQVYPDVLDSLIDHGSEENKKKKGAKSGFEDIKK